MKRSIALALIIPCLGRALPAQQESISPTPAPWQDAFGVAHLDGRTLGFGPRYTAEFDAQGLSFTPGLGAASPRPHQLSFELLSIRRGDTLVHAAEPTAPATCGNAVAYARGASIEERYEVQRDGVHQTFLFDEQPAGEGDLVVRGHLRTTLAEIGVHDDGSLSFEEPGLGGVRYGGVTGIDAAGRSAAGSLRLDGDALELVLPQSLVESAQYPLLLDPLVGSTFDVSETDLVSNPAVSYDVTHDNYLAVWDYEGTAGSHELRGVLVDGTTGAPGVVQILGTGSSVGYQASLANVNAVSRFLVAYRTDASVTDQEVRVRAIDADDGIESSFQVVGSGSVDHVQPDVGGRRATTGNESLLVWKEDLFGLRGAEITVNATGAPIVNTIFTLTTDPDDAHPAVSHADGPGDAYLVVWERDDNIFGLAADAAGNILAPEEQITLATTTNEKRNPDVDGDGTSFVVAYERAESFSPANFDIYAVPVVLEGGAFDVGSDDFVLVEGDQLSDELDPAVAHAGAKTFVAYSDNTSGSFDVYVAGLESLTAEICEPATEDLVGIGDHITPCLSAQWAGGPSAGDGLFLAWKGGEIQGQLLEAFGGGTVSDLGGGCAGGGTMTTSGIPAVGYGEFAFELAGADAAATGALLLISPPTLPFVCGCSTIFFSSFNFSASAVAGGATSQAVPIPCESSLAGTTVHAQWALYFTSTSPCVLFPNLAASNILEVNIDF